MTEGNPRPPQALPRANRVRKRADFLRIQQNGVRIQARFFVVLLAPRADHGPWRLGIVASRKVGGAVERNRAKRLVREAFRRQAHLLPDRMDIVIVVRPSMVGVLRGDIEADLFRAAPAIRRRAVELSSCSRDC